MTCQEWLKKCVYQRADFKNKFYSQLLTFMISAFWHGFYGGYYFTFILWFLQMYVSQLIFKESKKQNSKWVKMYKSLGMVGKVGLWLLSNILFSVVGTFFQILSIKQSWRILKAIYFFPLVFYILGYVMFTFGATKTRKPKDEKQQ